MSFSLTLQAVTIDYCYTPGQNIDGTHSINLSCALGSFSSERKAYDYYLKGDELYDEVMDEIKKIQRWNGWNILNQIALPRH
ncbi:MAG: hypothetical protein LBL16_01370 [Endomicrobium sp.]|jgi:hypothetical protein|nr:hypothetical protein [Endomicrobium sp.]